MSRVDNKELDVHPSTSNEQDDDNYQDTGAAASSRQDDINSQPEVMSSEIELLKAKVDLIMDMQKKILGKIETKQEKEFIKFEPTKVIELNYKAKFTKKLTKKRFDKTWRSMIKNLQEERVDADTLNQVKSHFLSGSMRAGAFVRKLAEILFGPDKLLVTLMGKDGKKLKGIKACDRNRFFKPRDEQLLLDLMKLVDESLFEDNDAFEYLVRKNVNQLGRDFAKSPVRLSPRCKHFNRSTNRSITDYFQKSKKSETPIRNTQCDDGVINID